MLLIRIALYLQLIEKQVEVVKNIRSEKKKTRLRMLFQQIRRIKVGDISKWN